jgi:hypothetical protein
MCHAACATKLLFARCDLGYNCAHFLPAHLLPILGMRAVIIFTIPQGGQQLNATLVVVIFATMSTLAGMEICMQ